MDKISTKIKILGYEYAITGEGSISRVEKVRDYVQGSLNKLSGARLSDEQRAVLTALRAADELISAREAKGVVTVTAEADDSRIDDIKTQLDQANKRALEAESQLAASAKELKMVRDELSRAREEAKTYAKASSEAHGELTKAWEVHGELTKAKNDLSLAKGETLRQTAAAKEHSDRADALALQLDEAIKRAEAAEKRLAATGGKLDEAMKHSNRADAMASQLDEANKRADEAERKIVRLKEQIRTLDAQKRRMEWARK